MFKFVLRWLGCDRQAPVRVCRSAVQRSTSGAVEAVGLTFREGGGVDCGGSRGPNAHMSSSTGGRPHRQITEHPQAPTQILYPERVAASGRRANGDHWHSKLAYAINRRRTGEWNCAELWLARLRSACPPLSVRAFLVGGARRTVPPWTLARSILGAGGAYGLRALRFGFMMRFTGGGK